jgi:hypothetical protein
MTYGDSFAALRHKLRIVPAGTTFSHVLLVALGDSVTLGLTVNPELLHDPCLRFCVNTGGGKGRVRMLQSDKGEVQ